jgi:hypothetical protein
LFACAASAYAIHPQFPAARFAAGRSEQRTMHADYIKLSEQYASFLSALGGITVTVLTIVLAIKKTSKPKLFSALVSALVVATLACFVGAHLMAQTAALTKKKEPVVQAAAASQTQKAEQLGDKQQRDAGSAEDKKPMVARHFVYASVNVYFALMLVAFSLMLLPETYIRVSEKEQEEIDTGIQGSNTKDTSEGGMSKEDVNAISRVTKSVFYFVVSSAYFWSFYYYTYRFKVPDPRDRIPAVFVIGTAIIVTVWAIYLCLLHLFIKDENSQRNTFILHIILIGLSVLLFSFYADVDEEPTNWDIFLFCFAIAISGATLWGLSLRATEYPYAKRIPGKWCDVLTENSPGKMRQRVANLFRRSSSQPAQKSAPSREKDDRNE